MKQLILFVSLVFLYAPANAAEATLPITVRILDCSTYEKAKKICEKEGKCCDIAERKKPNS